jgi:hypothetical protein
MNKSKGKGKSKGNKRRVSKKRSTRKKLVGGTNLYSVDPDTHNAIYPELKKFVKHILEGNNAKNILIRHIPKFSTENKHSNIMCACILLLAAFTKQNTKPNKPSILYIKGGVAVQIELSKIAHARPDLEGELTYSTNDVDYVAANREVAIEFTTALTEYINPLIGPGLKLSYLDIQSVDNKASLVKISVKEKDGPITPIIDITYDAVHGHSYEFDEINATDDCLYIEGGGDNQIGYCYCSPKPQQLLLEKMYYIEKLTRPKRERKPLEVRNKDGELVTIAAPVKEIATVKDVDSKFKDSLHRSTNTLLDAFAKFHDSERDKILNYVMDLYFDKYVPDNDEEQSDIMSRLHGFLEPRV